MDELFDLGRVGEIGRGDIDAGIRRDEVREAFGRTGKKVRLMGLGVRFASLTTPDATQLDLL